MSSFTVDSDLLAAAAPVIRLAATNAGDGSKQVRHTRSNADAFGNEPILEVFLNMTVHADEALGAIEETTGALAANVAAAALGYLHTDEGVAWTLGLSSWGDLKV